MTCEGLNFHLKLTSSKLNVTQFTGSVEVTAEFCRLNDIWDDMRPSIHLQINELILHNFRQILGTLWRQLIDFHIMLYVNPLREVK